MVTIAAIAALGSIGGGLGQQQIALATLGGDDRDSSGTDTSIIIYPDVSWIAPEVSSRVSDVGSIVSDTSSSLSDISSIVVVPDVSI